MRAPGRRRGRAALAVACAVLLLGGCAGDDGGTDGDAADQRSADEAGTPSAAAGEEGSGAEAAPDDAPDTPPGAEREYSEAEQERLGAPVPEDELTAPGDREFSTEEAEYLDGRVPEGAEPGAVLEAGEEACARVAVLARHDPDGAVAALRDGEPAGAAEAIPTLCPEHQELLDAALG